jgi:peroxiredoxin
MIAVQMKAALSQKVDELTALEDKLKQENQAAAARVVHARVLAIGMETAQSVAQLRRRIEEVKKYIGAGPLKPGDAELAERAGQMAEWREQDDLAAEIYAWAGKLADKSDMTAEAKRLEACARRMKLVGKELRMEGKTLAGKDLDWAKYRGKVVLVNFSAVGYAPCRAEIENIKENYKRWHDRGFEVVGISTDAMSAEQIAALAKKDDVPWTICRDADASESMAEYYGITMIPASILVGGDGKVVSLHAEGQSLGPCLERAIESLKEQARQAHEEKRMADKETAQQIRRAQAEKAKKAKAGAFRTWTAANGVSHTKAKFRGVINDAVKLELENGKVIEVPLEKLSDDDQEYIRKRKRM